MDKYRAFFKPASEANLLCRESLLSDEDRYIRTAQKDSRVVRCVDTPEKVRFWQTVDDCVAEVATWPEWRREAAEIWLESMNSEGGDQ